MSSLVVFFGGVLTVLLIATTLLLGWLIVKNGYVILFLVNTVMDSLQEFTERQDLLIQQIELTKEGIEALRQPWLHNSEKSGQINQFLCNTEDKVIEAIAGTDFSISNSAEKPHFEFSSPFSKNCLEISDFLETIPFSSEAAEKLKCKMGHENNDKRWELESREAITQERFVQTDEEEILILPICGTCSIQNPGNNSKFPFLLEKDSKPGIYQPPIGNNRSESIYSTDSSGETGSPKSRKGSFSDMFESDTETAENDQDWRKVSRKPQRTISFCESDKSSTIGTRTPSPANSHWNIMAEIEIRLSEVRMVQQNQINAIMARKYSFCEKDTRSPLVIGVDARPTVFSGYCINLRTRVCQFYSFPSTFAPWRLQTETRREGNPPEFEMKNLCFALLLWEKDIEKYKKFSIYTDNNAVNRSDCQYGQTATTFLEHFTGCKDVIRVNSNVHVHRKANIEAFSRYIQPADDLSHFLFDNFKDFMKNTYGNISFVGSHEFLHLKTKDKPTEGYPRSTNYRILIEKVTRSAKERMTPCSTCGFYFPPKYAESKSKQPSSGEVQVPPCLPKKVEIDNISFHFNLDDFPRLR